jgi:hypothetical protein
MVYAECIIDLLLIYEEPITSGINFQIQAESDDTVKQKLQELAEERKNGVQQSVCLMR